MACCYVDEEAWLAALYKRGVASQLDEEAWPIMSIRGMF